MYTIGTKHNEHYPIWNPIGDIVAECLNYADAVKIITSLNHWAPRYNGLIDNNPMNSPNGGNYETQDEYFGRK